MDNELKRIRQECGLTQEQLSEKSGVARSVISALENGHSESITTKTMTELAKALKVSVAKIFFIE